MKKRLNILISFTKKDENFSCIMLKMRYIDSMIKNLKKIYTNIGNGGAAAAGGISF